MNILQTNIIVFTFSLETSSTLVFIPLIHVIINSWSGPSAPGIGIQLSAVPAIFVELNQFENEIFSSAPDTTNVRYIDKYKSTFHTTFSIKTKI